MQSGHFSPIMNVATKAPTNHESLLNYEANNNLRRKKEWGNTENDDESHAT